MVLDTHAWGSWFGAVFVLLIGLTAWSSIGRRHSLQWGTIQEEIEKEIKRREALS
jgi:branched-chain amino acid transport system permease protein